MKILVDNQEISISDDILGKESNEPIVEKVTAKQTLKQKEQVLLLIKILKLGKQFTDHRGKVVVLGRMNATDLINRLLDIAYIKVQLGVNPLSLDDEELILNT
jgi:hypothetical protein